MDTFHSVLAILDEVLNLHGASSGFTPETKLRGTLPQLDSMAIVSLIAALEEQLGIEFPEEDLDGSVFETLGTLVACVEKIAHGA